nr:NAD(P)-dependent alcohol dehydrogenase [Naasia lichenicola]
MRGPEPGEVRVRIMAAGICHADLIARDQMYPVPLPAVLGHEGAGIVEECGSGVQALAPGDHVVLGFAYCGRCASCLQGFPGTCEHTAALNFGSERPAAEQPLSDSAGTISSSFFGQSSFAEYAIVAEHLAVRVPRDIPFELLAPLGCGVMTGAGTVFHVLDPRPGSSIAVFGAGAVGCAAIMAAVIAGCTTIIAVDVNPRRLEIARECGATDVLLATDDVASAIRDITGERGVDAGLDATGIAAVFPVLLQSLAVRGHAALVGAPPPGDLAHIDLNPLLGRGVRISTVLEGDAQPQVFIPELARLLASGRLPVDRIVSTFPFERINEAVAAACSGSAVKAVLRVANRPA